MKNAPATASVFAADRRCQSRHQATRYHGAPAVAAAQGAAPDFTGIGWSNSAPLKIADLRGKVVLVNF
jgi:hypothetical protein